MPNQFTKYVRIRLYKIVISGLFLLTVACGAVYFFTQSTKIEAIWVGLFTGLLIACIQYLLEWNEQMEIESVKKLGVRRILAHRDERFFYEKLIKESKREIIVLGNTAFRLLEDFAHATRSDSAALLEALSRGVKVRLLLPKHSYLSAEDRPLAAQAASRMVEIGKTGNGFEYKFFDHPPSHSLMRIDEDCLVGPIFPRVKSKDSPAIQVDADSPFASEYLKYFEEEWKSAGSVY